MANATVGTAAMAASAAAAPAARAARKVARKAAGSVARKAVGAAAAAAAPAVDPLAWWGALTQQFSELAKKAVKDTVGPMTENSAGAASTARAAPDAARKPSPTRKRR
jgi:hypothetical protein